MDDLISREAVANYVDNMPSELTEDGRRMIRGIRIKEFIADCPSAFDRMTNGEVIQAMFPNSKTETISFNGIRLYIDDEVHTKIADFTYRWWNAPYKAESEG